MKLFATLYDRCMNWSRHPKADWLLMFIAFVESSFFPIPPYVMLAPMVMAKPWRWWKLAATAALFSALGGLLGYVIGFYGMNWVRPWLEASSYWPAYVGAMEWFNKWGIWAILLAGFSPIPYKVFTIAAGALHVAVVPFFLASVVSRSIRFLVLAKLMAWGGPKMETTLQKHIERIGWAVIASVVLGGLAYWWLA